MKLLRSHSKPVAAMLVVSMTALSTPIIPAHAALVGTDRIIEQTRKADQPQDTARTRVTAFLEREDVRAQLESMGISPTEAQARVAALSDEEVRNIAGKIDTMPAGEGVFGALIGAALIVFLVLLITDLLGLTHVFGFTNKGSARSQ